MADAAKHRAKAHDLPEGDAVRVLLEQHARIVDLFGEVRTTGGEARQAAFDRLRALLAVHEISEEMVLRPVSQAVAGHDVIEARNEEERQANAALQRLEKLDVDSAEFTREIAAFEKSVLAHAEAEESEEFPAVLAECDADERQALGRNLELAEKIAPTHAHPSTAGSTGAQYMAGPFASIVDRARDAFSKLR